MKEKINSNTHSQSLYAITTNPPGQPTSRAVLEDVLETEGRCPPPGCSADGTCHVDFLILPECSVVRYATPWVGLAHKITCNAPTSAHVHTYMHAYTYIHTYIHTS